MKTLNLPPPVSDQQTEGRRFELAAALFQQGRVSIGRAAELCGMHKLEFMAELGRRKIPVVNWDGEEIRKELANV